MFITRLIIGSILIIVLAGILAIDHFTNITYGFTALLFIITALALYEFYTMHEYKYQAKLPKIYGILMAFLLNIFIYFEDIQYIDSSFGVRSWGTFSSIWYALPLLVFVMIGGLIIWYLLRGNPGGMTNIYIILFGLGYIWFPLLLIYLLRVDPLIGGSEGILLFFIIVNKGADSGAYFGGTLLGKHKLAPKVSPNKTVEGLISALVIGVLIGFLFWYTTELGEIFPLLYFIPATFLITLSGQIGDLVMSLIKRYCGVKHSSNLLSAHGGVLDLIDSLLVSGPVVYILFKIIYPCLL